jgi:4-diphosphocytidyl-2-C-methyl-D-erythritol kinase
MSVRVFAPAKIILILQVGHPRADGLHPLQSVVMFADVGDIIEATPADNLTLTIGGEFAEGLAADETNLVLRAAHALAQHAGIGTPGAAISLEKTLPVASGIGGGSADAAATLRALNELWQLNLEPARLQEIARTLGADVPVCVASIPAYMTGAGETWSPMRAPPLPAVLINPLKPLPTPDVYRRFDAMGLGAQFAAAPAPDLTDAASAAAAITAIGNDLKAPAQALCPALSEISAQLRADKRVRAAGLSGSGATMFALTETAEEAAALAEDLQRARPDWWACETMLAGA